MLILSRNPEESITFEFIDCNNQVQHVEITYLGKNSESQIRLGFKAHMSVKIMRNEIIGLPEKGVRNV